jgi:uncharacterized protein YbjT (DUF2867 family)
VTAVPGDLADIDSVRTALDGVSTLFLVVANATDELSKAMLTLNAAREAKVKGIVYLSVFKGEQYSDVPRFASKVVIERMIETCDLPATILRPISARASFSAANVTRSTVPSGLSHAFTTKVGGGPSSLPA